MACTPFIFGAVRPLTYPAGKASTIRCRTHVLSVLLKLLFYIASVLYWRLVTLDCWVGVEFDDPATLLGNRDQPAGTDIRLTTEQRPL